MIKISEKIVYDLQYLATMINEDYLKKLKENENAAKKTNNALKRDNQKTNKELSKTESLIGGIGKALKAIAIAEVFRRGAVEVIKANKAFQEQQTTLLGLAKTAEAYSQNQNEAIKAAKGLESELLSLEDAAQGIQFLLGAGFNVNEAFQIGQAFKDIGAFNRVVDDMGQAFVDASKGIKTGSIELIENIGLTERLSNVLKRNNVSMKDGIDLANNEAQRRAVLNSIIEQGNKFRGNEQELLKTSAGESQKLDKAFADLYKLVGERVDPAFKEFNKTLTGVVRSFSELIKKSEESKTKEISDDVELLVFQYDMLNKKQSLTVSESKKLEETANKLIKLFPELGDEIKALSDEDAKLETQNKIIEKIVETQEKKEIIAKAQDEINKLTNENIQNTKELYNAQDSLLKIQQEGEKASKGILKGFLSFFRKGEFQSSVENVWNTTITNIEETIKKNNELIKQQETIIKQNEFLIKKLNSEKKVYEDLYAARFSTKGQEEYNKNLSKSIEITEKLLSSKYKDPYASRFTNEGQRAYNEALNTAEKEAKTALLLLEIQKKIEQNRKEQKYVDPYADRFTAEGIDQSQIDLQASIDQALLELKIKSNSDLSNAEEEYRKKEKENLKNYYEDIKKDQERYEKEKLEIRERYQDSFINGTIGTLGELINVSQEYNQKELHDWSKSKAQQEGLQSLIDLAYAGTYAAFGRIDQAGLFLASAAQHATAAALLGTFAGVSGGGVTGSNTTTTTQKEEEKTTLTTDNETLIKEFGKTQKSEEIILKPDPASAALNIYPELNKLVEKGYTIKATKLK